MRVLVACEFSGVVRDAFIRHGHDAMSCDLLPSERPGPHYQGDVRDVLGHHWDLMVAHPPCTDLAVSGARYFAEKIADGRQQRALDFVRLLMNAPIERIAVENPVSVISSHIRKPDQIVQPYWFGHPESKTTCLWLKNLPLLVPTKMCEPTWWKNPDGTDYRDSSGKRYSPTHYLSGRMQKGLARWENQTASGQNKLAPSPDRWRIRSRTYEGIAEAMAVQWGAAAALECAA